MRKEFQMLLDLRKAKGIKTKPKNPPKWLFPTNAEKHYDKILYSLTSDLKRYIKEFIMPAIPSLLNEVEEKMPNEDHSDIQNVRQDDYLNRLKSLLNYVNDLIKGKVNISIAGMIDVGYEINTFNKSQAEKLNRSIFGIDIFVDEPWLTDQLRLFASQNAELIKSLPSQELERVAGEIERGMQQGMRFKDVATGIQKSFGITKRRATLIARDQTTKLNASLTKLRQQEVGVEEYIWQTAGDERVRPTHRHNNGKTFKWDTPPQITGHPGNDVNCRCIARPVLNNLIKDTR